MGLPSNESPGTFIWMLFQKMLCIVIKISVSKFDIGSVRLSRAMSMNNPRVAMSPRPARLDSK